MADAPDAPIFLLGSHGSGSTMLRLMLDSHERIAIPPETGVMRLVAAHRWVPFWPLGRGWHERLDVSAADLDRMLAELYGGMFARYAAARGKERWGEKTPFHVWHVDDIRRLFPDAVFVAIVRHPLGSVASVVRRFDRPVARAARGWLQANREIVRQAGGLGDGLSLLRYEDLVGEPEPVLRALLTRLGEPWSPRVLAHHEVQREQGAARVVEGGTRATDAVDAGRTARWRSWLEPAEQREVLDTTRALASVFGYGEDPDHREPFDGGTLLLSGTDVALRAAAVDGLQLDGGWRPAADGPYRPRRRRGGSPPAPPAAHTVFDRLPPRVQRRLRTWRHGDG